MLSDSLAMPVTRERIHEALSNLGLNLQNGALMGATPLGSSASNSVPMPIILSFDSVKTKKEVLKAAKSTNQRQPNPISTFGEDKPYFTDRIIRPRTRQSSAPKKDSESDNKTWEEGPGGYHFPVQDAEGDESSELPATPNQQLVQDEGPQNP